jgi:hypothetical protein
MKRVLLCVIACIAIFAIILSGCASKQNDNNPQSSMSKTDESIADVDSSEANTTLQIRVESGSKGIIFALNDSSAAKALYEQLPLTLPIENYSTNEKIFYPPEKLDVSDTPLASGSAGTLAYYEPWGDVVIFYGEFTGANGLYSLGEALSGAEEIENLSGEIRIEKVENFVAEPSQESGATSSGAASKETANSVDKSGSSMGSNSSSVITNSSVPASSEHIGVSNKPTENTSTTTSETEKTESTSTPATSEETEDNMRNIKITVNGETFSATLNDNEAARAFAEMLPLTLDMSDYSGFEKVGPLGTSLPTDNQQTTTQSGDIVLYNGNQIVIFYGSNSWSYTRLGKIDDLSGWKEALGSGDVTVTFSIGG